MHVITAKNLTAPAPSADWMQKLKACMAGFAGPGDPLDACSYDESWSGRQAYHCIYSVGLQTIANLKGLESVKAPLCWRFIAGGHKKMNTAAGCWCTHESNGTQAKVMASFQGEELAEVLACTERLNQLTEVAEYRANKYEMRVLRIPALCIEAFWLKSRSSEKRDLMVPYGLILDSPGVIKLGAGATIQQNKTYPVADFLEIVGKAARRRLAATTTPAHARTTLAAT
jgi:hypothetical protein